MKTILKVLVIGSVTTLLFITDTPTKSPPLKVQLVPEAQAVMGVRRRTRRRTAVVVGSTSYAAGSAQAAAAQQQAAAAQQQTAATQQEAAAAKQEAEMAKQEAAVAQQQAAVAQPAPQPAAAGQPLPLGTVVPALPAGCTATPVGGVQYYYCGGNFYRAVFQGNALVYVTAQPK